MATKTLKVGNTTVELIEPCGATGGLTSLTIRGQNGLGHGVELNANDVIKLTELLSRTLRK